MKELAAELGISQRQCERLAAELKQSGTMRRIGSTKNGHWEILT